MDLTDPGSDLGSPALQADSLPTELSAKPIYILTDIKYSTGVVSNSISRRIQGNGS